MAKPVYVFSGFLDSGKTTAIKDALYNPRFNEGEKTLIIALEQGDVDYDEKFLKATHCEVVYLDSVTELTRNKMQQLDQKYRPERVFIELNGIEDDNILYKQGFIRSWELAQTLTVFDGSVFRLYLDNMRQFVYNHVVHAEVVVFNRMNREEDILSFRNNMKSINQRLEVIFENENGILDSRIEDKLFDVSKDLFIEDADYGLWYMDAVDNPLKYDGAKITLKVKWVETLKEYENTVIMGRKAMVCCANDIQDIALTIVGVDPNAIDKGQYQYVTGTIRCLDDEDGYKTCVLYADKYENAGYLQDELVVFN